MSTPQNSFNPRSCVLASILGHLAPMQHVAIEDKCLEHVKIDCSEVPILCKTSHSTKGLHSG